MLVIVLITVFQKLETTLKDCQAAITSVSSPSHTALQLTTLRVAAMTEVSDESSVIDKSKGFLSKQG